MSPIFFNIIAQTLLLAFTLSFLIMTADGGLQAPEWNSEGPVSFREYYTELMAWLAITGPKHPPQAQAGALQMAMRGTARKIVFRIPPQFIQFGAIINGRRTDPVTYILYVLGNRLTSHLGQLCGRAFCTT